MFFKILNKNFAMFTRKKLCRSLFSSTLLKKRLYHRCFPINIAKFLRTAFFIEHLYRLLLPISLTFCRVRVSKARKPLRLLLLVEPDQVCAAKFKLAQSCHRFFWLVWWVQPQNERLIDLKGAGKFFLSIHSIKTRCIVFSLYRTPHEMDSF